LCKKRVQQQTGEQEQLAYKKALSLAFEEFLEFRGIVVENNFLPPQEKKKHNSFLFSSKQQQPAPVTSNSNYLHPSSHYQTITLMSHHRSEVLKNIRTTLRHLRRMPSTRHPSSALRTTITNHIRSSLALSAPTPAPVVDSALHSSSAELELERAQRVLAAYAENVSSVQTLNTLRGLDTGEKMTQR
jgi:hypothetical protein